MIQDDPHQDTTNLSLHEEHAQLREEHARLRQRVAELERSLAAKDSAAPNPVSAASSPPNNDIPYQDIFDHLPLPLVVFRADGLVAAMDHQNEEFIQASRETLVGIFNMFDDQEAAAKGHLDHFKRALAGKVSRMPPTSYDTARAGIVGRREDRLVWSETIYFPIPNESGQVDFVGELSLDVSEQVQAEEALREAHNELEIRVQERTAELVQMYEALRESEERHRIISELITDYVYSGCKLPDGGVVTEWISGAFERITGYTLEEISEMGGWLTLVHPEDISRAFAAAQAADTKCRPCVVEYRIRTRDGNIRWLRDYIRPVWDDAEQRVTRNVGAVQDITEARRTEEALRVALEQAESASRAKSEFLAAISHEIRTPLNAIIGMTSLLLEAHISAEEREFVEIARTSGNALLVIINDILDFARIETGTLKLEEQAFNVHKCIEDVIGLFERDAAEKCLDLSCHIEATVPSILYGDVSRLQQIMANLLSNAIKFTPQGEVALTVENGECIMENNVPLPPDSSSMLPSPFSIHITVCDTGIGIPPERMQSLFQPFTQLDATITRRYGGIGLGLAISKQLAEMMDGTIWVDSEVGRGSTFHVTLVMQPAREGAEKLAPSTPLLSASQTSPSHHPERDHVPLLLRTNSLAPQSPLRILVAEDNIVNQKITLRLLEHLGYRADVAANGLEVLDALERQQYDVILMDVQMPEMDGLETTHRVRTMVSSECQPRIIGVASLGAEGDQDQWLARGMDDYIHKPVRLEELAGVLAKVPTRGVRMPHSGISVASSVFQRFRETVGADNPTLVSDLVTIYLAEAHRKLTDLWEAREKNDHETIYRLAYSLMSSSAQLGAMEMAALCEELVTRGQSGSLEGTEELLEYAEKEFAQVKCSLLTAIAQQ